MHLETREEVLSGKEGHGKKISWFLHFYSVRIERSFDVLVSSHETEDAVFAHEEPFSEECEKTKKKLN